MERKEEQSSNKTIYRRTISVGVVSHIQEIGRGDEPTQKGGFEVLDESATRQIIALNLRKIVFAKEDGLGRDIFYKLGRNNPYCYEVMDYKDSENSKHNSIVIRYAARMDELLAYAGYGIKLSSLDLRELRKLFLTQDKELHVIPHDVKLPELINPAAIEAINKEASNLSDFKTLELPTRPLSKEKAYAKYFK